MGAMDLLKKTQKAYVSSQNMSPNESIDYTHDSGIVVENLLVLVDHGEFNDSLAEDKKTNSINLYNVILDEAPTTVDTFKYNNIIYKVREWKHSLGMYIISAENNKRNRVTTTTFR